MSRRINRVTPCFIGAPEQRKRLPPRHEPYYVDVAKGIAIGYRKGVNAASWFLRRFNGTRYHKRELGQADDGAPADAKRVLSWPEVVKLAIVEPARADAYSSRYSVQQCITDYFEHRRARTRSIESVRIDEGKVKAFNVKFGDVQVSSLTTGALQAWRDRLVVRPRTDADLSEAQRRDLLRCSQGTVNRTWSVCRAGLNHAYSNRARGYGSGLAPHSAISGRGRGAQTVLVRFRS